jgi:hypothetical protein
MSAVGPEHTFSVALRVTGAAEAVQRTAIASVSRRFHLAREPVGDVVVLEPSSAAWPGLLNDAVREGVRGVMVAGRTAGPPGVVRSALENAAALGVAVVLYTRHAMDVAWRSVAAEVAADAADASVLDSVVTWSQGDADHAASATRALLDQLAVVRPLIGDGSNLHVMHSTVSGYEVVGDGPPVTTLTGVHAPVRDTRLDLDLVSGSRHWRIRFDSSAAARPVVIQRMDGQGVREMPLRWEGSARASWVALHEQLVGLTPITVDEGFLADLDVAGRLAPRRQHCREAP